MRHLCLILFGRHMSLHPARWSFAASGTATGLISNGVSYFLLIYYSQVLGLDPELAGLVMMIALMVDAVSDPLVGRWSDGVRHRLGRRHPFLFLAALPIALLYYLIWDPPALGQTGLFFYLLAVSIGLRLALTAHVVPFNALLPELTDDYDERTRLMNFSYCAAWFFGTVMAVAMYAYWLADTPGAVEGSGILRAEGYVAAGIFGAVVVAVCLVAAAVGTRGYIPRLTQPISHGGDAFRLWGALKDRNFAVLVVSGLASSAAAGTSTALWAYMQPYFWGFDTTQTSMLLAAQLLSAVLAFALIPKLVVGREKKDSLIVLSWASLLCASGPVFAELLGFFPAIGSAARFNVMLVLGVLHVMFVVMIGTVTASMIADIVDARAVATGRREEGLLFAVLSFVGKVATGLGIWVSGLILAAVAFPTQVDSYAVEASTVEALGWIYAPVLTLLYVVSVLVLHLYDLTRQAHQRNVQAWQGGDIEL